MPEGWRDAAFASFTPVAGESGGLDLSLTLGIVRPAIQPSLVFSWYRSKAAQILAFMISSLRPQSNAGQPNLRFIEAEAAYVARRLSEDELCGGQDLRAADVRLSLLTAEVCLRTKAFDGAGRVAS